MVYKIVRLLDEHEGTQVLDGVPFPTGIDFEVESPEDRTAAKLLKFIDGERSLRRIGEELPLAPRQIGEIVSRLYDLGAIAFDPDFCDEYLVEDEPARPAGGAAAQGEAGAVEGASPSEEGVRGKPGEGEKEIKIEIIEEGDVAETPLWQRLNQLERKMFTGRISLNTKKGRREFYYLNGALTFASSDVGEEDIGKLLLDKKKLTQPQYEAYKREAGRDGRDPYDALVDLGAFPAHQKLMAQRWAAQVMTYSALDEREGTFVIERWERLPRGIPKLGLNFKGIMSRFMEEKLPVEEEAEKLKEKMHWWLSPVTEKIDRSLSDKEERLWEILVERPQRLSDIMTLTTMYKKETYRFILLLLTSGYAELTKKPPAEEGPIDLRRLDEVVETIMESNFFDVLTVHPVSDTEDINKAYNSYMAKFNLSAYRELTEEQKKKLLKMKGRVEEAWGVLKEEKSRREYRKKTFSDYQLRQYAQLQYQKGEIYLWWRHDAQRAGYYFWSSMDLDPANPLYWAAYSYAVSSMSNPDPRTSVEANRLAEKAAGHPSTDPTIHVFAGGALLRTGKRRAAEAEFEKARKSGAAGIASLINIIVSREKAM